MKKLAIIGASAAFAALPMVGVFADVTPVSQTDTITITVQESCELATTGTPASTTKQMAVGTFDNNITGSTFKVACNTGEAWELQAKGASEGGVANALHGATNGNIASSETPSANFKKDSATSDWGFKLTAGGATNIETGYDDWKQIPTSNTKVATGSAINGTDTVTVTYGVAIGNQQKPDTYTGKVTYTLSQPGA